jgi:hypothetical protein
MKLEAKPNRAQRYISKFKKLQNLGKIAKTLCMLLAPLKRNILQRCAKLSLIVFISARVGAQGGSLSEVCKYGMNNISLLINSSRGIILMGLILPQKPDKRQSKCNRKWKELLV